MSSASLGAVGEMALPLDFRGGLTSSRKFNDGVVSPMVLAATGLAGGSLTGELGGVTSESDHGAACSDSGGTWAGPDGVLGLPRLTGGSTDSLSLGELGCVFRLGSMAPYMHGGEAAWLRGEDSGEIRWISSGLMGPITSPPAGSMPGDASTLACISIDGGVRITVGSWGRGRPFGFCLETVVHVASPAGLVGGAVIAVGAAGAGVGVVGRCGLAPGRVLQSRMLCSVDRQYLHLIGR